MSDESFFREVNEELRQDRLKSIWTRFGTMIVVVVVALILATAAYVGWDRYARSQANESGDRYLAAQALVADQDIDGALDAFRAIAADGWGTYPELARMSIGNTQAAAGRTEDAVASYADVANDDSIPPSLREMADLRAAYLLVDAGTLDEVRARAERLTGDDNPLRYAARDAIAMAAWKAGETETARDLYQSITEAGDVPQGIAQRAALVLGLMSAQTPPEAVPAEAGSPADAPRGNATEPTPAAGSDLSEAGSPTVGGDEAAEADIGAEGADGANAAEEPAAGN